MVTNTAALQEICSGDDGILAGLQAGSVYIDMSTISVDVSRAIAEQVASKGAHMLDVPISGTRKCRRPASSRWMDIVAATSTVFRLVGPLLWWMDDLAYRLSRVPALL